MKFERMSILELAIVTVFFLLSVTTTWAQNDIRRDVVKYPIQDSNDILWFVHISDLHININPLSENREKLSQLIDLTDNVIKPAFVVATGDLTDNCSPCDLREANCWSEFNGTGSCDLLSETLEWITYRDLIDSSSTFSSKYFDIPGNHDHYDDRNWDGYKNYARRGNENPNETGQFYWNNGKYGFLSLNTCDQEASHAFDNVAQYNASDFPNLDTTELTWLLGALNMFRSDSENKLTFLFGHHSINTSGEQNSLYGLPGLYDDIYIYPTWTYPFSPVIPANRGATELFGLMNTKQVSVYAYGHTHENRQTWQVDLPGNTRSSTLLVNTGALKDGYYRIFSIDNGGVSTRYANVNDSRPVVLITSPVDRDLGGLRQNLYAKSIPNAANNKIRALVFSRLPSPVVRYYIDGKEGQMNLISGNLYEAEWDASQPTSNSIQIKVAVDGCPPNEEAQCAHTIAVDITNTIVNNPPQPPGTVTDYASFVPGGEGLQVSPGPFSRVLNIKNTGSTTWTTNYKLVFCRGDQMSGPSYVSLDGSYGPGSTANIQINLIAPSPPKTYEGIWRMQNDKGVLFGDEIPIRIQVPTTPLPPSYPSEEDLIRGDGTIWVYLYKYGKRWWVKNEDIFAKMGYQWTDVKIFPWSLVSGIPIGPTIVENGTLIRQQGDIKVYLIQNNQRRWITSPIAFTSNGYNWEDVIDATPAIIGMYSQGQDITLPPNVLVNSPNGGEKFLLGNTISIVWKANDDSDVGVSSISLYYSTNGGVSWSPIASGLANTGSYLWTPNFTSPTVKVKAVASDYSGISSEDPSDGNFSIEDIYRYVDLNVTSVSLSASQVIPGQQITVNTTVLNEGNQVSNPINIKYYFSTTHTGRDNFLAQGSIPSLGAGSSTPLTTTVTIPSTTALVGYIVAVANPDGALSEITHGNNTGSSPISIIDNQPPTINSLSFGWGYYKTGYEYPIVFDVTDNNVVKSLGFYYSIDNQTTWNTITSYFIPASNGSSNSYQWTIPASITLPASMWIKLVARDASGNTSERVTGPYQIKDGTKPGLAILSPNGGEIWDLGSSQTITWNVSAPNGVSNMSLYLQFADRVDFIANITNNTTGSYTWTVPLSSGYVTNTARIRISLIDLNGNPNEDWSDNYFVIRDTSTPPPPPWTTPQVITTVPSQNWPYTSKDHGSPAVATDKLGNIHMAYKYLQDDGSGAFSYPPKPRVIKQDILYKKLTGSTWSDPSIIYSLTQETDSSLTAYHELSYIQIAIDVNNNPHVVWTDALHSQITDSNQDDIFYTWHNGSSWSTPVNVSNDIPGASPLKLVTWSTKTNLLVGKKGAASAVFNGKLYVFGGNQLLTNYVYDPSSDMWTQIADSPPFGVSEGGAAVIGNKIYVVGDGPQLRVYDPLSNSWTCGPDLPTARRSPAVASVNGELYVIGGADLAFNKLNKNEMYDPISNAWTAKADMPTARGYASVAVVDNKIYVIGGFGDNINNNVEVYDPSTNSWTAKMPMQKGRMSSAAVAVDNKIYVIGGRDIYDLLLKSVEEYDPQTDIWLSKTPMPTARMEAAGGAIGNNIYVVGGYDRTNVLSINEQAFVSIGGSGTVSEGAKMAIDASNNVHLAWNDGFSWNSDNTRTGELRIYYRKKDNSGSWSPTTQVPVSEYYGWLSMISDTTGNLHMAYEVGPSDIEYIKGDGATWSSPLTVTTKSNGLIDLARDVNDHLHVVWYYYDSSAERQEILYSYYDGVNWSVSETISDIYKDQPYHPSIAVDSSNRPHVIFEDASGKLIYRYKDTYGWSVPLQLNLITQQRYGSDMTISLDDRLHVVWETYYNGHQEIFYNYADVSGSINDITPPSVSVTYPSAGSILSIGSMYNVIWSASDNIGVNTITIEYTTDNEVTFTPVATGETNDGVYQWTVPNITSNNVQIRITARDATGNTGIGLSRVFSIADKTSPFVAVTSPNGGESWIEGTQQAVQWTSSDNVGVTLFDLYYSVDGGVNWSVIASGLTTSPYLWTIPSQLSSNCKVKVVAKDGAGNVGQDLSDGDFVIVSANRAPNQPTTSAPGDGASGVAIGQVLTWAGGDPDAGDAVTYDIYFGTGGNLTLVSSGQTESSYNPGSLSYGQVYYWQVIARDNYGNSSVGPVWSFVTQNEILPVLGVSPLNLSFQSTQGSGFSSQSFGIWNSTGGSLNWSLTDNVPWLSLNPAMGSNSGMITALADTTGLMPGTYNAIISITATGATNSPVEIPVTLVIADTTPPTGSIVIDGGKAYTTNVNVTLTLSATDAGSGVSQMRFSNDEISWSAWESYATSRPWILTSGNGIKTVYVQYQDGAGNPSGSFSSTILLTKLVIDFDGDNKSDIAVW